MDCTYSIYCTYLVFELVTMLLKLYELHPIPMRLLDPRMIYILLAVSHRHFINYVAKKYL